MAFTFRSQYDPDVAKTMRAFYQTLSERDRRRYVAVEAQRLGHGGINGNSLHCSLSRQHRVRPFLEILKLSCPLPNQLLQAVPTFAHHLPHLHFIKLRDAGDGYSVFSLSFSASCGDVFYARIVVFTPVARSHDTAATHCSRSVGHGPSLANAAFVAPSKQIRGRAVASGVDPPRHSVDAADHERRQTTPSARRGCGSLERCDREWTLGARLA